FLVGVYNVDYILLGVYDSDYLLFCVYDIDYLTFATSWRTARIRHRSPDGTDLPALGGATPAKSPGTCNQRRYTNGDMPRKTASHELEQNGVRQRRWSEDLSSTTGESIQTFLVRETLMHEEFVEAIIRLHEDKLGVSQESRDFGLPSSEDQGDYDWEADYGWSSWWDNGDWYEAEYEEDERDDVAGAADPPEDGPSPGADRGEPKVSAAPGSSPSHHRDGGSVLDEPSPVPDDKKLEKPTPLDELTLADSFILDVLRGWRLLQAAGLSHEEKRDILSTTKNSLDYSVISSALQGLWDDQLLGRHGGHPGSYNAHYLQDSDVNEAYYQHGWWDDQDDDAVHGWHDDLYYTDAGYEDD
ncbi:unnamed protein product, partial [Symbiodinium necroappetens]